MCRIHDRVHRPFAMGIQDRDYMRERHNGEPPDGNGKIWWIVGCVAMAFIVYFALVSSREATTQARPAVVNVNRASLAELNALPRINESVAQAIIDGRPYTSTDDLIRVYGIGPKTLESIRPYVKITDENPQP